MNNGGRRIRRPPQNTRGKRLVPAIRKIGREVQASGVVRVNVNRQLTSVPNHNYQLKLRKFFRVFSGLAVAAGNALNLTSVRTAVERELGLADTTTAGTSFTIHAAHVYGASSKNSFSALTVGVYATEETGTTSTNLVALFEDNASMSGIANINYFYPLATRPTFSRSTAEANVMTINSPVGDLIIVDLEVTVVRTPTTTSFRHGVLTLDDLSLEETPELDDEHGSPESGPPVTWDISDD